MGKELFSVSTDKVAEGALATSAAVATAMYIKSKIDKKKQEEASKLLEIFNRTLGTADFPKPFNLDRANDEISIPKELQQYTLEQIAHGNPYERVLSTVGYHLSSYNNHRNNHRGKKGDPIHSVLCYLHYILLSPSGLMGLTGKDDGDFKKLEMFASFLEKFAQMDGAKSRVSFVARILEIMPTQQQHGSQQALDQKEQDQDKGFRKSINAYTALQGIADSVNAEVDFSRLERLSRRFADSTLRLATMGVSSQKIHAPLTTALLDDIAVGTVVPAIEKKGLFSIDESAIVLPTDDTLGFIPTIQQVAASLKDFNYQSDTLFKLTDDQLKELITTEPFKKSEFNVNKYSKTDSGTTKKTPLSEENKLKVARGYVAMLQLAQISADIARLAHYMNVHIRTESASSAAPFAFSTSGSSIATRKRCYEMMELLKDKADKIYQKKAKPLIVLLHRTSVIDGIIRPQAAYTLAGKLGNFKKELDNAYGEVKKYNTLDQFEKSREQSQESIQKLEQEVSAVAQKYRVDEEKLTQLPFVPDRDYKEINDKLTAHVESLSTHFSSEEFIRLAQGVFGGLVSCKGRQVTFDIQRDADLIRLEALAEDFIEQLEVAKKSRPTHPSAMLGSVSGPDLAFGYMPSQESEDPQALDKRLQKRKKRFRESTQRYAAEAKPREETKAAAAAAQEKIARLTQDNHKLLAAATVAKNGFDKIGKKLGEAKSEIDQLRETDKQSQETIKEAEEHVSNAKKETSAIKAQLDQAQEAIQKQNDEKRQDFQDLQSEITVYSKILEANNKSLMKRLNALAISIPDQKKFEELRDDFTSQYKKQLAFLNGLIVKLDAKAQTYQENSEEIAKIIADANKQVALAETTLLGIEQALDELREQLKSRSSQLEDANKTIETQADQISELTAQLTLLTQPKAEELQPKAEELQPKAEEPQLKAVNPALSRDENTYRTRSLLKILNNALGNLQNSPKKNILEILRNDLQEVVDKKEVIADSDFKRHLQQILGAACQHRGLNAFKAKDATTTGNYILEQIEQDTCLLKVVTGRESGGLDFQTDVLKRFLGVEGKALNKGSRNPFYDKFVGDKGQFVQPEPEPNRLMTVAASA
ncbi:ATPase involved in DNA repair [Piscirickettsia salmonis]|uniref:hypothetical protein n=1 Tax=Piscirickettsia salmonis TaxID=1238 RepID=UPI0012BA960D|nr:hypothetical protein [Piscirickettsia salmonis]QGP54087.1 ATPase involved in DNA repair [Piscirickettsia salmonis]QGP60017.1 ATPase involved in DNA repair [Piscirickettsia salmonis]QGP63664.1 ATPase involved in DNA repair [Piscirickettsia salmonis]